MKKILSSEITPHLKYLNRRNFIKNSSAISFAMGLSTPLKALHLEDTSQYQQQLSDGDELNTFDEITTYNNFYEFGMGKSDPYKYSSSFNPKPWSIKIEGLVEKPFSIDLEDLLKNITIEDRIYRLRCVEAWSMVIPWQGFPLSKLIEIAQPLDNAKFKDG